jgi:hypothetical protein
MGVMKIAKLESLRQKQVSRHAKAPRQNPHVIER